MMIGLTLSAAAFLLASTASASPTQQERSASVVRMPGRHFFTHPDKVFDAAAGRRERHRIRIKYGSPKIDHPDTTGRAAAIEAFDIQDLKSLHARKGKGGADILTDSDATDQLYYGLISIGTPAQVTNVDFDTGSSDLVVPMSNCFNCTGPLLNGGASSTFRPSITPFSIHYADKSGASGTLAADVVTVAGLTVKNQTFGAVTNETTGFSSPNAGLMGLGFTANAESGAKPFFINLAEQGKLASNVFSFYLARHGQNGSELCFGCKDSSKYHGKIKYFPLDPVAFKKQLYWNIAGSGLSYGGKKTKVPIKAIIDSGTTLIYVPSKVAKSFYSKIKGAVPATKDVGEGLWTIPCASMKKLKPVEFIFGGKPFAVHCDDFNLGPATNGSALCVGAIGEDDSDGGSILGDAFMKNFYSVFDYGHRRVGFAPANHKTKRAP